MAYETFQDNINSMQGYQRRRDKRALLRDVKNALSSIPQGQDLLDDIERYRVKIEIDYQLDSLGAFCRPIRYSKFTGAYLDRRNFVLLSGQDCQDVGLMVTTLCHEMQHVRQEASEAFDMYVLEGLESACQRTRLVEADADSYMVEMAYLLKQAGHEQAWKSVVNEQSRMAGIYQEKAEENPEHITNGVARFHAFKTRCSAHSVVQNYDKNAMKHWRSLAENILLSEGNNVRGMRFHNLSDGDVVALGAVSSVNYVDFAGVAEIKKILDEATPMPIATGEDRDMMVEIEKQMKAPPLRAKKLGLFS